MAQRSKITILNVDDDDASRYAVSRILKQAGFEVLEAASGEEALRLVDNHPDRNPCLRQAGEFRIFRNP